MKKWSKRLAVLLALMMIVWTLAACGSSDSGDKSGEKSGYQASKVNSDLSAAEDVQDFVDKVDTDYAYDLTKHLAYSKDLMDNDLGWRSAGSDAEHKTAEYLRKEMNKIGLTDVEKVPVPCDKFQFNDSELKLSGTEIDLEPASYQCNGTGVEGLDAEIVDVNHGLEADYEGKNVKGKIVLAGIDQKDESWIDGYIREADEHGAAALVTYGRSGYGQANDETVNVQDICCPDLIPTCAVSKKQGEQLKSAIKEGHNKASLMLDAEMVDDGGTTYNVVGKIKGVNHNQRILVSGHYDKYWYGFQDDCAAIGLVFTVAKSMIESGYKPQNDIVFVAHGAEEWGTTDSQFDWTTGAWGMIEKQKDWQGSTLAMLNCELPAFRLKNNEVAIGSVPEFRTLAKNLVDKSGLAVTSGDVSLSRSPIDSTTMEDGVSYRWHGVPYFINSFEDDSFIYSNYHTRADNKSTWNLDTMRTNINWYGAMAMYVDSRPALELDLTQTAADLEKNFDSDLAKEADVKVSSYEAALDNLKEAGEQRNDRIAEINDAYEKAAKSNDTEKMNQLRRQGQKLNRSTLAAFRTVQDDFLKDNDFEIYYGHKGVYDNIKHLDGAIKGLQNKELWADDEESGALDNIWQLNANHEYNYCIFSTKVARDVANMYSPKGQQRNVECWGYQKAIPVVDVGDTTYALNAASGEENPNVDWDEAIKVYQKARRQCLQTAKSYCNQEISDINALADALK
ncbi:MAG: M28 family peptidase [Anaerovoracaceae bacterium]|jgi:Iap family predicted aminopeptidase